MAHPPIYIMVGVDVRRGTDDQDTRHQAIDKMALAEISFKTTTHSPGGGIGDVDIVLPYLDAIAPKFSLKGFDPAILGNLGLIAGVADIWTFAGALMDKNTGAMIPARATIRGIIAKWTPGESEVGGFVGCDYEIKSVRHYDFSIDGRELWYIDHDTNTGRADGVSWTDGRNRALAV